MKPSKTFKLTKTFKRMLATITDDNVRSGLKDVFIQAQLESEKSPVREKQKS